MEAPDPKRWGKFFREFKRVRREADFIDQAAFARFFKKFKSIQAEQGQGHENPPAPGL